MDVCYIFIFYIHHFSLNRTDVATRKDVSLIIKGKMNSGKCQCFFEETCPMVITIFQTVEKYALSLVRCQGCQVWTMGRVVLQVLWFQCLVNSTNNILWAQIYYNTVRNNFGIIGHNSPFISF